MGCCWPNKAVIQADVEWCTDGDLVDLDRSRIRNRVEIGVHTIVSRSLRAIGPTTTAGSTTENVDICGESEGRIQEVHGTRSQD